MIAIANIFSGCSSDSGPHDLWYGTEEHCDAPTGILLVISVMITETIGE